MKWPDTFVCISKLNMAGLSDALAFPKTSLYPDNYWDRVVESVTISPWYNAPRPTGQYAELWDGRAAMLEAIYFDAQFQPPALFQPRRKPLRARKFMFPPGMVPPQPLLNAGGAQRGISLATGTFTGESKREPLGEKLLHKYRDISSLGNHDFGRLDSFGKSSKSSLSNPLGQIHLAKSSAPDTFKTTLRPGTGGVLGRAKWLLSQPTGHGSMSVALSGSQVKARQAASSLPAPYVAIGRTAAATAERENADGAIGTVFAPLRRAACGLTPALLPTMIAMTRLRQCASGKGTAR